MLIIWGFGKKTIKNFGFVPARICGRCNNNAQREIMRITTWFTLFFIPIIPYRREYYLTCPICSGAQSLSKEEFRQLIINESNTNQSWGESQSSSSQNSDQVKYAGKNATQIAYLKEMEAVEKEKASRSQN